VVDSAKRLEKRHSRRIGMHCVFICIAMFFLVDVVVNVVYLLTHGNGASDSDHGYRRVKPDASLHLLREALGFEERFAVVLDLPFGQLDR
jgi:hypothetical protein